MYHTPIGVNAAQVNKALAMRLALGVYLYDVFKARTQGATIVEAAASGGESSRGKSGSPAPGSALEYISDYQPRVVGLLHTAPVYDGLTVPQSVPIIAGCVQSKKSGCNCYDQRGNHYGTTQEICAQFIDRGIFFAFKPDPLPTPTTSAKVAAVAAPAVIILELVPGDLNRPGAKFVRELQGIEPAKRRQKHLLAQILGILVAIGATRQEGDYERHVAIYQQLESPLIAPRR